jgi:hypothetical protein
MDVTTNSSVLSVRPFPSHKRSGLSPVVLVLVLSEAVLSEAVIEIHSCDDLGENGVPRGRRVVD